MDNYFRMLNCYMDIRCFDYELTKLQQTELTVSRQPSEVSSASNVSINPDSDYAKECVDNAIDIFLEYLAKGARSEIQIANEQVKIDVFKKFGYCPNMSDFNKIQAESHICEEVITEEILLTNLNKQLFLDLFGVILDELRPAFN